MPPIDHDTLATKAQVDLLGRELRAEIGELRGETQGGLGEVRMELANAVRLLVTVQIMSFGATLAAIIGAATFLAS